MSVAIQPPRAPPRRGGCRSWTWKPGRRKPMPSYEFHPAAEYFPLHTPEEFAALVMSLQRYGFDPTHPIVLCDDIILDGRNRYRACQELGIEALLTTYVGNPYIKVWRENAARREL